MPFEVEEGGGLRKEKNGTRPLEISRKSDKHTNHQARDKSRGEGTQEEGTEGKKKKEGTRNGTC